MQKVVTRSTDYEVGPVAPPQNVLAAESEQAVSETISDERVIEAGTGYPRDARKGIRTPTHDRV